MASKVRELANTVHADSPQTTKTMELPQEQEFSVKQAEQYLYILGHMQRKLADVIRGEVLRFPAEPMTGMKRPAWRSMVFFMNAERRYILYLDLLKSCLKDKVDPLPLPPWDVAMVFNAHLLNPYKFYKDLNSHGYQELWDANICLPVEPLFMLALGKLPSAQSHHLWRKAYPTETYDYFATGKIQEFPAFGEYTCKTCQQKQPLEIKDAALMCFTNGSKVSLSHTSGISSHAQDVHFTRNPSQKGQFQLAHQLKSLVTRTWFDLPLAAWRQLGPTSFVTKVTEFIHPDSQSSGEDHLKTGLSRYLQFMTLLRDSPKMLVPTLDIDLFWHTHQISPVAYRLYCETHIGRWINHDDTVPEKELDKALQSTREAWVEQFEEMYTSNDDREKQKELMAARTEHYKNTKARLSEEISKIQSENLDEKYSSKKIEEAFEAENAKLQEKLDVLRPQQDEKHGVIEKKRLRIWRHDKTFLRKMPFYMKICRKRVEWETREDMRQYQALTTEIDQIERQMRNISQSKDYKLRMLARKRNEEVKRLNDQGRQLRANIKSSKDNISNCAPCTKRQYKPSFTTPDLTVAISTCWGIYPGTSPDCSCDDPKCHHGGSSSGNDSGYNSGSGGDPSGAGPSNSGLDWSAGGGTSVSVCGSFSGSACGTSTDSYSGSTSSSSGGSSSSWSSSCGSSSSSSGCGSSSSSGCGSSSSSW